MNPKHVNSIEKVTFTQVTQVTKMHGEKKVGDFCIAFDGDENIHVGYLDFGLLRNGVVRFTHIAEVRFSREATHGEKGLLTILLSNLAKPQSCSCTSDQEDMIEYALDSATDVEWYDFSVDNVEMLVNYSTLSVPR